MDGRAAIAGAWLRRAVLAFAVVWVLVMPVANPGSGTAVNLHRSDDAAAAVRADHHAKTLPAIAAAAMVLAVVAIASRRRAGLAATVAPVLAAAPRDRRVDVEADVDAGPQWRAPLARRGPPALV